jgi:antibiotic biosynthesis monooxygenase (ABM) superfamily enzyme
MGQGHRLTRGRFVAAPRHKLAVATWLAIYPTITLALPGLEAFGVNHLALPLRTLAISLVVVPAVVFVVAPAVTQLLSGWLHAESPPAKTPSAPGS